MDRFLHTLTGGITVGTNRIEFYNPSQQQQQYQSSPIPPPGGINWVFRRDHINQEKEKVGITVNSEMRLTALPHSTASAKATATLAGAHPNVLLLPTPQRWFVVAVNGRLVGSESEFWHHVLSSLDVRITLCDATPVDELLMQISKGISSTAHARGEHVADVDDDDDALDFSPTATTSNIKSNSSDNNNDSKHHESGEPDYAHLLRRDPVRYAFLQAGHPLFPVWDQLRIKTIKARDALKILEQQLQKDEEALKEEKRANALALLDSSSDDESGDEYSSSSHSSASDESNNQKQNNSAAKSVTLTRKNIFSASSPTDQHHHRHHQQQNHQQPQVASIFGSHEDDENGNNTDNNSNNEKKRTTAQKLDAASLPEGAISYTGAKPPPPTIPAPFIAYTQRAEQNRKLFHTK